MQMCNAEKLPEVTEHKKTTKYETKIEESANASTGSCLFPALGDLRGKKPAAQPAQPAATRTKCKFDQRLVPRLPATVARSEKWPVNKNDFQPAIVFMESARDVSHLEDDKFVHAKEQVFGEQLKDSPLQKLMCCGSTAPAYIRDLQQENDADTAAEQLFACLPTSSVPKTTFYHIPYSEKGMRMHCSHNMLLCGARSRRLQHREFVHPDRHVARRE